MGKFKIGQSVVCINNTFEYHAVNDLQTNHIYTIVDFNEYDGGIVLEGIKSGAYKGSYQSKRFVALEDYNNTKSPKWANLTFSFNNNKSTYVNNKIATFCDVKIEGTDIRLATGVAYCGDNDEFNENYGKKLALKRALKYLSDNYNLDKYDRAMIWKKVGLA